MASAGEITAAIERSRLVPPDAAVLAMLSGGSDSVCLLHALLGLIGGERLRALHVNHGLRAAADDDERFCRELCDRLGVPLTAVQVEVRPPGNLEALAREGRYDAAERVREREGLDLIATGHTASDQTETILYRLVTSPGRRALLGMRPRRGRIILLESERELPNTPRVMSLGDRRNQAVGHRRRKNESSSLHRGMPLWRRAL